MFSDNSLKLENFADILTTCSSCHQGEGEESMIECHIESHALPRININGDQVGKMNSEKLRHQRNELRSWSERETSEPLHTCTSLSVSPSLAFTYVSFLAGHLTQTLIAT